MVGDSDFYEDDEPLEDVLRAFREGEKYVTAPPQHQGLTLFVSFAAQGPNEPSVHEETRTGNPAARPIMC